MFFAVLIVFYVKMRCFASLWARALTVISEYLYVMSTYLVFIANERQRREETITK